jgi:hypothetical protein
MLAFRYENGADKARNLHLINIICVGDSVSLDLCSGWVDGKTKRGLIGGSLGPALYLVVCS